MEGQYWNRSEINTPKWKIEWIQLRIGIFSVLVVKHWLSEVHNTWSKWMGVWVNNTAGDLKEFCPIRFPCRDSSSSRVYLMNESSCENGFLDRTEESDQYLNESYISSRKSFADPSHNFSHVVTQNNFKSNSLVSFECLPLHLLRMEDSRWPKKIYQWTPQEKSKTATIMEEPSDRLYESR